MEAAAVTGRGCALVTGASRGIGAAVARGLAADGWAVGVNYRAAADAAEGVVEAIRGAGGEAVALCADVSDRGAADDLCSRAEREWDLPILVLVNNAGAIADGPAMQLDDESWQRVIDTNLSAAFGLTRRVLRPMLRSRFGRIVNIASIVGQRANPGQSAYAASKAGLVAFTKTVAVEVAPRSVTVNAIAPGVVDTDSTEGIGKTLRAAIPAGRAGTVEEVAACARFLASEQASYVTGSVLTVDGGLTA
jgi:3-oxoacyl-[acyl-carrier protein] reductase